MRLGFFVALRALTIFAAGIQISAIGICQTGNTVVGSGYSPPVPIPATRGQLLTIYVQSLGVGVTGRRQAESLPLPTSLAGILVSLEQAIVPNGPFAVPLLAVFPVNSCPDRSGPCGTLTGINLQIPYELVLGPYGAGGISTNSAKLIVSENGITGAAVGLNPSSDQLHVLRYGDSLMGSPSIPTAGGGPLPGSPVVTHADGSLVTVSCPAHLGEAVVIYAVGLGLGQVLSPPAALPPPAATGSAPATHLLAGQVAVRFDFRLNAAPSKPLFLGSPTVQAWLVAGNVGLYQVNVVVPLQLPHSAGSCGCPNGPSGCPGPFQPNLTIDLGGLSSYDGAQICVAVAPH